MSKIKCKNCGERVPAEETYGAEVDGYKGWVDVCSPCYSEIVEQCQECGEDMMPSQVSGFALFKWELAGSGPRPPGVYYILDYPFLSCPMIGSDSLMASDVLFVDKLPKRDEEYEISGKLCCKCAEPHEATMHRVYPSARLSPWRCFDKAHWNMERRRTREVLLANPQVIRDLECSRDNWRWERLRELYDLPEMRTWNDWLFLEHAGVKVYSINPGHEFGWFALRPEPEYRNTSNRSGLIFDASSLPTWPKDEDDPLDRRYSWQKPKEARQAIVAAIDQGILTQDGIRKEAACA